MNECGVEILNSTVLWSRSVELDKDVVVDSTMFRYDIPLTELSAVSNSQGKHSLQIISVATGNDMLDSIPAKALNKLVVLPAPGTGDFLYSPNSDSVKVSFEPVSTVSKYKALIFGEEGSLVSSKVMEVSSSLSVQVINVSVDSFIDKVHGGDYITGAVQSLSDGSTLSSMFSRFSNKLQVSHMPTDLQYLYATDTESVTLTCSAVEGIPTYKLGFRDPTGKAPEVMSDAGTIDNKGKVTAAIPSNRLSQSNNQQWQCFAQAIADSSNKLPSPHAFLTDSITVLTAPSVMSVKFDSSHKYLENLLIEVSSVAHATDYQVICSVFSSTGKKVIKTKSQLQSPDKTLVINRDMSSQVSDWDTLIFSGNVTSLTVAVAATGSGLYITSKPSRIKTVPQAASPSDLSYSYSSEDDVIKLQCAAPEGSCVMGLTVNGAPSIQTDIIKIKKVINGKASATIPAQQVREGSGNKWAIFAQSRGGEVCLPSKRVTLQQNIQVLEEPKITSFTYDAAKATLSISWSALEHSTSYQVVCSVFHPDKKVIQKTIAQSSSQTMQISISMSTEVSDWESLIFNGEVTSLKATVTATGDRNYITSKPSKIASISQTASPSGLSYKYSPHSPDFFTLKCNAAPNVSYSFSVDAVKAVSLTDTSNPDESIMKVGDVTDGKAEAKFAGGQVRSEKEWACSVQSTGNGVHLPSRRVSLQQHIFVLDKPDISTLTRNNQNGTLSVIWRAVQHASYYRLMFEANGTILDSVKVSNSETEYEEGPSTDLPKFRSLKTITCSITACGEGWYITGRSHEAVAANGIHLNKPANIYIVPSASSVTVNWDKVDFASQYYIEFLSSNPLGVQRVLSDNTCDVPKYDILFPGIGSKDLTVKIIAKPAKDYSGLLPSLTAVKQTAIQQQCIRKTEGSLGKVGKEFSDMEDSPSKAVIVGVHSLTIIHERDSINSIQAVYWLDDNSTWTAPKRGDKSGSKTVLVFDDREEHIISLSTVSTNGRLSMLEIVTEKRKERSTYMFGNADAVGVSRRFEGNVVCFLGACDQYVNFLATYFTPIYSTFICKQSDTFGSHSQAAGPTSTVDDEPTVHGVMSIREVDVGYVKHGIISLQATYLLKDGTLWKGGVHGNPDKTEGEHQVLKFEPGQEIIRVFGTDVTKQAKSLRTNVGPLTFIKHSTASDMYNRSNLFQVGPYSTLSGDKRMLVSGRIEGFFSQSASTHDGVVLQNIGFWYSLWRSELFEAGIPTGGADFDDLVMAINSHRNIVGIKALHIQNAQRNFSIQVTYLLANGSTWDAPKHGGHEDPSTSDSDDFVYEFKQGEEIVRIWGCLLPSSDNSIGCLRIQTTLATYEPFGWRSLSLTCDGGTDLSFDFSGRIIAFYGHSVSAINAIGVYYIPNNPYLYVENTV